MTRLSFRTPGDDTGVLIRSSNQMCTVRSGLRHAVMVSCIYQLLDNLCLRFFHDGRVGNVLCLRNFFVTTKDARLFNVYFAELRTNVFKNVADSFLTRLRL